MLMFNLICRVHIVLCFLKVPYIELILSCASVTHMKQLYGNFVAICSK